MSIDSNPKYAADTGVADAYLIAPSPAITAYTAGQIFYMKATNANTGASTINVNSLGLKNIKKDGSDALIANDILSGQAVCLIYDGTNFQLMSPSGESVYEDATQTLTNKTLTAPVIADGVNVQAGKIKDQSGGTELKVKVINIGDWNMDVTNSVSVAHGLTLANIRNISASIRSDSESAHYTLLPAPDNTLDGWIDAVTTVVPLYRLTGGLFDSVNFDSTSYNRCWVTIWYTA